MQVVAVPHHNLSLRHAVGRQLTDKAVGPLLIRAGAFGRAQIGEVVVAELAQVLGCQPPTEPVIDADAAHLLALQVTLLIEKDNWRAELG